MQWFLYFPQFEQLKLNTQSFVSFIAATKRFTSILHPILSTPPLMQLSIIFTEKFEGKYESELPNIQTERATMGKSKCDIHWSPEKSFPATSSNVQLTISATSVLA